MHISPRPPPRPFPGPFEAGQAGPAPDAFLARLGTVALSIGAAVLIVGGVLLTPLFEAPPARVGSPAIVGP